MAKAPQNFVHKHGMEFNKAQVHVDRKKNSKRGHIKHKKKGNYDGCPSLF
jgi:hypothetical protein